MDEEKFGNTSDFVGPALLVFYCVACSTSQSALLKLGNESAMKRKTTLLLPLLAALAVAAGGCSSAPDLVSWRHSIAEARPPADRGTLSQERELVASLRDALDLKAARKLALTLVAENPDDGPSLLLASRAESDAVFLYSTEESVNRDHAALSSLDLARRAVELTPEHSSSLAQLAYARGSTIHLQGMFSRAGGARETLEHAEAALGLDADNTTALATKATVRLRLATLPWIAKAMSIGEPEGSIEEAIALARRCVELQPSYEHRLLLAKSLSAGEQLDEARALLDEALSVQPRFPRDRELRAQLQELRDRL